MVIRRQWPKGFQVTLSSTCRPPAVDPGSLAVLNDLGSHIPVTSASAGGSHSQMEGFQAWDRHNPLPHIALSTTALKLAYSNTALPSTHTDAELRELLIPGGWEWWLTGLSSSSADVAGLREACYRAKAAAFQAG
jgi:hypothetical protein